MKGEEQLTSHGDEHALAHAVQGPFVGAVAAEGAVQDASATRQGGKRRAEPYQAPGRRLKHQALLARNIERHHLFKLGFPLRQALHQHIPQSSSAPMHRRLFLV